MILNRVQDPNNCTPSEGSVLRLSSANSNSKCQSKRCSIGFADSMTPFFPPPHKFETILALVVSQLGLVFEDGSDQRADQGTPKKQETRRESRPS